MLLLAFLAVDPISSSSVFAEGEDTGGLVDDGDAGNMADYEENTTDDDIELYTSTNSTVGISFSPASPASTSVTPVDSNGAKAKIDVQATVRVQNSDGYKVYVGSDSSELANGSNKISSVDKAYSYANLPVNSWGYSFKKASSATDKTVTDSYSAMPTTLRGTALDSNTTKGIKDETRYYMLSFAANIGVDKAVGTYSNAVTVSVVSSPLEISDLTGLTNMQDMTSEVCNSTTTGVSKQLKDTRDGKYYWVSKLADGKCWMTQNLALDLATSPSASGGTAKTFYDTDTDLNSKTSWTPTSGTYTTVTSSTILANGTGQRSWNLGSYYIKNPNDNTSCGYAQNNFSNCGSYFMQLAAPTSANNDANAHYLAGNYYQWCAATAGCTNASGSTGSSLASGEAADSICPKGWRLPTSNTGGEFQILLNAYDITSGTSTSGNITKLITSPLYFVRAGRVVQTSSSLFMDAGYSSDYWSSIASSSTESYSLFVSTSSYIAPSSSSSRRAGLPVRCLAR